MQNLDSDLLRTFLAVVEAGSVTGGAGRIHRSQSAASAQIKQLEAVLGRPIFDRLGRGIALNSTGQALLPVARQVTGLLDRAHREIGGTALSGAVRVGIPDDLAQGAIPAILAAFSRDHPGVELTVRCAPSAGFPEALGAGALDLAVHEVAALGPRMELLHEEPLSWVRARDFEPEAQDPLPVALFDQACWWRKAALEALERSGRRFRIAYSSESVAGVAAAIDAGIAVGVLGASAVTERMVRLAEGEAGWGLPPSLLVLEYGRGAARPETQAMAEAIRRALQGRTGPFRRLPG